MRYQVIGDTMPAVEVVFDRPGETMYTLTPSHSYSRLPNIYEILSNRN